MKFRRVRTRASAGLLGAGLLLSACSGGVQPPAAVVGGHRISQDAVQEELHVFLTNPQVAQEVGGPSGASARKKYTRQALFFLIQVEVARQYAAANGIAVTASDVDQQLNQTIQQFGSRRQFQQELAKRGLSLEEVRANIGQSLLLSKAEDAVAGPSLAADQQKKDAAFATWLRQRLTTVNIEVNPRFGRIEATRGAIVPITSTQA